MKTVIKIDCFRIIVLSACMILCCISCSDAPSGSSMDRPTPIAAEVVSVRDVPEYVEAIGNAYSPEVVKIRPQVTGLLLEFHGSEGQQVNKGDLLFTIDPKPFQTALERTKANSEKNKASLEFSKARLERYTDLLAKDYVSKLSYEEFKSEIEAHEAQTLIDQADIAAAQINLDFTSIYSPIDGVLGISEVDAGNLVSPNDSKHLVEIRQISPIDIRFSLSQKDFQKIKKHYADGKITFEFTMPGEEAVTKSGVVYFVNNHVDPSTGTILLKGSISNEDGAIWPGEFGQVRVLVNTLKDAYAVPEQAIQRGQKGKFIYVVKDDQTVEPKYIDVGCKDGHYVVIKKGLEKGDKVVTDGQIALREGSSVFIVENKDSAAP